MRKVATKGRRPRFWAKLGKQPVGIRAAYIGVVGAVLAALIAVTIPAISNIVSAPPALSVSAGKLSIATVGHDYRVLLPIFNPQSSSRQITKVAIEIDWSLGGGSCGGTYVYYQLGDDLTVAGKGKIIHGNIVAQSSPTPETVRATGTYIKNCFNRDLSLAFTPPALILDAQTVTVVVIDIPENLKATYSAVPGLDLDPGHLTGEMGIPSDDSSNVLVNLSLSSNTGDNLKGCGGIGDLVTVKDGPPARCTFHAN